MADQLQVGDVAGGQRVEVAAAPEGEALDRPRADLADREQPAIVAGIAGVAAAGGDLAGGLDESQGALRRQFAGDQLGRGERGDDLRPGRAAGRRRDRSRPFPSAARSGAGSAPPPATRSAAR
jgi:hypothetical protein